MLNTAPRGTKRKRMGGPQRTHTHTHKHARVERAAPSAAEVVARKLHHGVHEVRKAAKKAVAFELRKVVKRLKQARTQGSTDASVKPKGEDAAELERQLEVLKSADHEQFADTALRTKVLKDKLLAPNADVAAALAEKLAAAGPVAPQAPGSAAAKVHGRLLSSKTVAEAVRAVVDGLREAVDPSLAKGKKEKEKFAGGEGEEGSGDSEDEDDDDDDDEGEDEDAELVRRLAKGRKLRLVAGEAHAHSDGSDSEEEAVVDDAGWESGTVDGDEDGWESGSIDGADNGIGVAASSDEDDDEDDEGGESSSSSDADLRPKAKPAAKDAKGKGKAASTSAASTFLPSLSVGFTRGDSDASDLSDGEAEAADVPRKNRRGQRARRAIWEKKYGRNANHVKSNQQQQQEQQQQRPQNRGRAGHDPRQQPQPHNRHGGAGGGAHYPQQRQGGQGQGPLRGHNTISSNGGRGDAGWGTRAGAARGGAGAGASASAREETALHPSWEAKRKLKEKLNPSIVPAQGKKITF